MNVSNTNTCLVSPTARLSLRRHDYVPGDAGCKREASMCCRIVYESEDNTVDAYGTPEPMSIDYRLISVCMYECLSEIS